MTDPQPIVKAKRSRVRWGANVRPILPASAPKPPPRHLEQPEAQLWREITETYVLDDHGALEMLDTALQARARMRRCRQKIDADGETIKDRWGQPRAHPLLVSERGAQDSYLKAMRLLNLDIAAR
jgi:hypothetical protein